MCPHYEKYLRKSCIRRNLRSAKIEVPSDFGLPALRLVTPLIVAISTAPSEDLS